ncbi:MAG: hypothetical protein ACXVXJ_04685 [Mycobacteriaceae bacterium]
MTATCPSCGCIQPEGLLCHDDSAALETMLAAVPQLVDQLNIAIAKQARIATVGGIPFRTRAEEDDGNEANLKHTRSPINWGVVAVRDALVVEAAFVGQDINWVRSHPQAGEMLSSFGRAVKNGYQAIDRARNRQYLGTCLAEEDGAVCHAELWVKPGANQHRCTQCETVHEVAKRRAELLEKAEDLIVTPREASQYVGEVGGITVGHQRIRNYLDRRRIAKRPSVDGTMRLRLGDLLDVLRDDAERKSA